MANTPERAGAGTDGSSPDWRQLGVVALAALARVDVPAVSPDAPEGSATDGRAEGG